MATATKFDPRCASSVLFLSCLFQGILPSPILVPRQPTVGEIFIPPEFCILPPEFGTEGKMSFLEDCDSLFQYPKLPIPVTFTQKVGIHPRVCCPKKRYASDICFPSDAWCPTYEPPEYEDFAEFADDGGDEIQITPQPTMADDLCYGTPLGNGLTLDTCVQINQCHDLLALAPTNAPQTVMQPCGFDDQDQSLMICCPSSLIKEKSKQLIQPPRFPLRDGSARPCTDKHELCPKWKRNDGCALDRKYELSLDLNGHVDSKTMFDFMQDSCLESCGWCGDKGCVDELPDCVTWARNGMCIVNPFVMAHTCRESCGVCGFLSPLNSEEQVVGGNSYSDFTKKSFDCGRFKLLTEVNPHGQTNEALEEIDTEIKPVTEEIPEELIEDIFSNDVDLRSEEPADVFFSSAGLPSLGSDKPDFFCGATIVNDRWVVAAAHCYDNFGSGAQGGARKVNINTLRENTVYKDVIEIKRVFKHPLYKYPNLYNDVAILELGRRIEYDWDLYGDTPSCIDQGRFQKEGKIATIQGYGLTENGTRGDLLETNVTIISNQLCKKYLEHNTTDNKLAQGKIARALPQGLNYGLLCAQGEMTDDGVFKGSCKGDSGGPLTSTNPDDRTTLVGIVSGGVGCGDGYPGWYTRVDFFAPWIQCIIQTSRITPGRSQKEVLANCEQEIEKPKTCSEISVDDVLFGDLRSGDDECGDEFLYGGLTEEDVDLRKDV